MPIDPESDAFWEALPSLHCHTLTETQWEVLALTASGLTPKEIGDRLDRHPTTIRDIKRRAGEHAFARSTFEPTDGSLGSWYSTHRACCREAS